MDTTGNYQPVAQPTNLVVTLKPDFAIISPDLNIRVRNPNNRNMKILIESPPSVRWIREGAVTQFPKIGEGKEPDIQADEAA